MHKKLASELTSIAHSILQMKNKEDVNALKQKAYEVYEKLSVLAYVEEYINTTPSATETKEELIAKVEEAEQRIAAVEETEPVTEPQEEIIKHELSDYDSETSTEEDIIGELDDQEVQLDDFSDAIAEDVIEKIEEDTSIAKVVEEIIEQPFDELEEILNGGNDDDNKKFDEASFIEEMKSPTLEEELKDTISVDVTADLFTKVEPKKSLNERLQNSIQIGLNDRIAFVKHLFDGDSGDFNRVVSQLNTFDTEKEAKKFINKTVKPDYDWSEKEEYETRFLEIIERRFA